MSSTRNAKKQKENKPKGKKSSTVTAFQYLMNDNNMTAVMIKDDCITYYNKNNMVEMRAHTPPSLDLGTWPNLTSSEHDACHYDKKMERHVCIGILSHIYKRHLI
jgi:hypothetical protein